MKLNDCSSLSSLSTHIAYFYGGTPQRVVASNGKRAVYFANLSLADLYPRDRQAYDCFEPVGISDSRQNIGIILALKRDAVKPPFSLARRKGRLPSRRTSFIAAVVDRRLGLVQSDTAYYNTSLKSYLFNTSAEPSVYTYLDAQGIDYCSFRVVSVAQPSPQLKPQLKDSALLWYETDTGFDIVFYTKPPALVTSTGMTIAKAFVAYIQAVSSNDQTPWDSRYGMICSYDTLPTLSPSDIVTMLAGFGEDIRPVYGEDIRAAYGEDIRPVYGEDIRAVEEAYDEE